MSKLKSKLTKRIVAIVLSGAMIMSNMSAYAAELSPETETEIVSEVEETVAAVTAEEDTVSDANEENTETEASVTESTTEAFNSESKAESVETETEGSAEIKNEAESEANYITETEAKSEEDETKAEKSEEEQEAETKTAAETDNTARGLTYTLDFAGTDKPENGTAYTTDTQLKNYFTVKIKASGGAITPYTNGYIRIKNNNRAALQFTTEETATVTLEVSSTGTDNTSYAGLLKIEEETEDALTAATVSGGKEGTGSKTDPVRVDVLGGSSDKTTITYELSSAGTYQIMSPKPTGGTTSDLQIYKITVAESGQAAARCDWNDVVPPEIKTITANDGTISVIVKGVVNTTGDGADYVAVDMYDTNEITTDTTPLQTEKSENNTEAEDHLSTLEFKPEASGDYYFIARLGRADETEKITAVSDAVSFILPLTAPTNLRVSETSTDSTVSAKVTWSAVPEAKEYVITVKAKDAAEGDAPVAEKTITVGEDTVLEAVIDSGLERGKTYSFSVIAKRDSDSSDAASRDLKLKDLETKTLTYTLDAAELEAYAAAGKTEAYPAGTEDFFTIIPGDKARVEDVNATDKYGEGGHPVFEDGYQGTRRINFDGGAQNKTSSREARRVVRFTTQAEATVKVWWVNEQDKGGTSGTASGSENRQMHIYTDETFTPTAGDTDETYKSCTPMISTFELSNAGTFYVGSKDGTVHIYKITIEIPDKSSDDETFTLDAAELEAYPAAGKTEAYPAGTEDFFTIIPGDKARVEDVNATDKYGEGGHPVFMDGYQGTRRINFDGGAQNKTSSREARRVVRFTTQAEATVKVWWVNEQDKGGTSGTASGSENRQMHIYTDETFTPTAGDTDETYKSCTPMISTFELSNAGTFYVGSKDGTVHIYKITVTTKSNGSTEPPEPEGPADWNEVANPTITVEYDDTYGARTGKIDIKVNAHLSDSDTEEVTVHIYDMSGAELTETVKEKKYNANGEVEKDKDGKDIEIDVKKPILAASTIKGEEHSFTFSPTYTSRYRFEAAISRKDTNEDGTVKRDADGNIVYLPIKKSDRTAAVGFTLPLAVPKILDYANMGTVEGSNPISGSLELTWGAVDEATGYIVTVADEAGNEVYNSGTITATSTTIKNALEIGKTYTFGVAARRDFTGANGGLETSDKDTITLAINEKPDTFEPGKYILESGLLATENKYNALEKVGKYTAGQNDSDIALKQDTDEDGGNAMNKTVELLQGFTDSNYFTIMYGSNGRVQNDNNGGKGREYPNGYFGSKRIAMGGTTTAGTVPTSAAIKFKTSATSRVDVYWRLSGNANRGLQLLDANGKQLGVRMLSTNSEFICTSFFLDNPGTYYLGSVNGEVCIARVVVYDGYEKKERPQWTTDPVEGKESVTAPVITEAAMKEGDNNTIVVKATADIGPEASADSVTVYMTYKDENGEEQIADYKVSTAEGNEHTVEFTPDSSNKYYFSAKMTREGEETTIDSIDTDAEGNDIRKSIDFTLPLGTVSIKSVTNKGKADDNYGIVEAVWSNVKEAVYDIEIKDSAGTLVYKKTETGNLTLINKKSADDENSGWQNNAEGLAMNATYTFNVTAMRAKPATEGVEPEYERTATATEEFTVTGKNTTTWTFSNFGSRANIKPVAGTEAGCGADSLIDTDPDFGKAGQKLVQAGMTRNGYSEILDDNDNPKKVRVWSIGTYGKIVPNSTDGVALYYTSVDPSNYNFKLGADVHVDQWTISNGQDGFGILAFDQVRDTVGSDTDEGGDVWNNSYMAVATKIEYRWDDENQKVSNAGSRASLRLGIGTIARTGVTAENISEFNNNATVSDATSKYFRSVTKPLDTQVHDGSYDNLIGNVTNPAAAGNTIENPITDLRLEIELNDTGYFVSYIPIENGAANYDKKVTNKFYDRNTLSQIDKDYVYPGFFAARNAVVTFSNIDFSTTPYDAATAQPESKEVEYVAPNYSIVSATTSNSEDYLLTYEANWHGTVIVKDENGDVILKENITGSPEETDKAELLVKLNIGDNTFQTTFEPSETYDPYNGDPLTRLDNYDTKTEVITVTYKKYGLEGQALYVAPQGKATGDGTQKNPLDIYTAVRYVQPGQTIYLLDGTYDLSKTVRVERGTDGTADKPIRMVPAMAGSRPVFDFHNACEGMVLAGDHWYFYGFDVTRSSDGNDGIRVCGDYNTLDSINTYKNGNTGIQISRLLGSDTNINTDWPKYNTIKNCTSYLNADGGYEDADGFACKLTSGVGNKFIGCVAAYNADDGWDFYAKVETGPIGMVTIENCIAYKNGYVLRADNGNGELAWYGEAENVAEVNAGNGNGFKMGGSSISGYHTLRNSLAFYNKAKGFDSNSCPDIQVYNSITFNNESYNVAFYSNASTTDFAARGLISYRTDALKVTDENGNEKTLLTGMEDRIGQKTSANNNYSGIINTQQKGMSKIFNGTNFFWNQYIGKSELDSDFVQNYTTYYTKSNDDGTFENPPKFNEEHTVKNSWFESVDFDSWFGNLIQESEATGVPHIIDRNANGTINVGKFLKLTEEAGNINAGLPNLEESTDDTVVSKNPEDFAGVEETNGTIDKGNAEDEVGSSVDSEDLKKKPGTATDQVGLWFSIVNEDEIGYTGKAVKPEVRVYYDNTLLTKKEYSITYKNNVNAWIGNTTTGTPESGYEADTKKIPTIIVKGKGNYIGQAKEIWFEIQPVDLRNDPQNRISAPVITLLKANQPLKPVLTFTGKKLSDKKDYTPAAAATTDENGKQWLEVTGKGNFTGTIRIAVRDASNVAKENLASSFKVAKIDPQYRRGYETDYTGRITKYLPVEPLTASMITTASGTALTLLDQTTGEGDITIEYVNNIEIGTATAIITGVNNYYGTKEVKFKIIAPPLTTLLKEDSLRYIDTAKLVSTGENANYSKETEEITQIDRVGFTFDASYPYEGKAIQWDNLAMAAKLGDKWYKLTNNVDYTLTYSGNNRAGSAAVIVKGKGNYSGSISQKFKITAFDISTGTLGGTFAQTTDSEGRTSSVYFEGSPSSTGKSIMDYGTMKNVLYYDKSGAKPAISLRINGNLMRAGKDYTIAYKNNTKVGDATFTIKGKGALTGTITGTYKIDKRPFNDPENRLQITATDVKLTSKDGDGFKGKNNTKIIVKDAKGKALSLNKDYVIDRYEYVDNSTYALLDKEPIADNKAEVRIANTDSYHTVKVTVKGTGDNYTDAELYTYYRITWGKNSIKSAKAQIIYDAGGKDNPGLANKYFYYKEGGAVTLNNDTLKLTLDGKELIFGVDYKVIGYSKNDRKGTAKLTIEGKGEYVETKVISFKIGADDFIWWKDKGIVATSQELLRTITTNL